MVSGKWRWVITAETEDDSMKWFHNHHEHQTDDPNWKRIICRALSYECQIRDYRSEKTDVSREVIAVHIQDWSHCREEQVEETEYHSLIVEDDFYCNHAHRADRLHFDNTEKRTYGWYHPRWRSIPNSLDILHYSCLTWSLLDRWETQLYRSDDAVEYRVEVVCRSVWMRRSRWYSRALNAARSSQLSWTEGQDKGKVKAGEFSSKSCWSKTMVH